MTFPDLPRPEPVVAAAVAVALGTGLGHGRSLGAPVALGLIAVLVIVAALARRGLLVIAIALLGCAATAQASWRTAAETGAVLPTLAGQARVEVCGVARSLRPRSVEIRVDRVEHRDIAWRTSEPVRLMGTAVSSLLPGERLCASGEVAEPREGFDEPPLLVTDDVRERGTGSVIRLGAAALRERFSEAAQGALPTSEAALLLGMTDGDVRLLDEGTVEDFRTTGLAHLVAVSGSNVAVLIAVVLLAVRRVRASRWTAVALSAPLLVGFAFLTGLEASVLRATVTAALALAVMASGRVADAVRVAAAAFVVLVLVTPDLLFHPGFQLSYAATLGLIAFARPLTMSLAARLGDGRVALAVAACIATTVAAQAAAAPLLAWHFGRIPALGGVANLVVAPLAPVVMIGGIVTLGLATVSDVFAWTPVLMRLPLDAILWCGRTFARLPAASVTSSVWVGIAVMAGVAAMAVPRRRLLAGTVAFVVAMVPAGSGLAAARGSCGGDRIVALDVGQGTAILLEAGDARVLVDGGPEAGGVVADLAAEGVGGLDAVFVSHPHADHTQGLVEVLDGLPVGAVLAPATIGWGQGAAVLRAADRADVPIRIVAAPDVLRIGPIEIEVVFPDSRDEPPHDEEAVHAFSLVLRARIGPFTVLLPGDVGASEERELLDDEVAAGVLVAPHHGSKDLDPAFVEAVAPRVVLITVGEDNRYGHPAPEALAAFEPARVYRTDTHGAVTLCGYGDGRTEVSTTRR